MPLMDANMRCIRKQMRSSRRLPTEHELRPYGTRDTDSTGTVVQ